MFKDLNKEEDDSKTTLRSEEKKILKIASKLEKVSNEKTGIASILLMSDEETAFVSTQGSGKLLGKALISACKDSEDFTMLIMSVAKQMEDDFKDIPTPGDIEGYIKDQVEKNGLASFDTPEGLGLAIDPEKIDELTDNDIDKIVDQLLDGAGIKGLTDDDDKSE